MSVEFKARVTFGPGHDDVAVFVATEPEKWALAGTLRPRHGDESDALLRRLERGMRLEGTDRETFIIETSPEPERQPLTVDDVAAVCEAAGLERDGRDRDWSDTRVSVEAVTTSCAPIGPGDPRPLVGIFVWAVATDRREDLTTLCSPALLRAVIDDVRAYPGQ